MRSAAVAVAAACATVAACCATATATAADPSPPSPQESWFVAGRWGLNASTTLRNLRGTGRAGGAGVVVAVLDSGVGHVNALGQRYAPTLGPQRFRRGWDFVGQDRWPDDPLEHGTTIAALIAQAAGSASTSTGVAIMPVRVLDAEGTADDAHVARGIRWAIRNHADIINLSFNWPAQVPPQVVEATTAALKLARARGVTVIAAAGNEAGTRPSFPGGAANVITVGASTQRGCLANYSPRSLAVDVVAPGGGLEGRHGRPGCGQGRGTGNPLFAPDRSPLEGTSYSAALVSGAVVLMIASLPPGCVVRPETIEDELRRTTRALGDRVPLIDTDTAARAIRLRCSD